MTSVSSVGGCGSNDRSESKPSDIELRALRALRRAGSHGLLHAHLMPRMRPARPTAMRAAIAKLEHEGMIVYTRESRIQLRLQGAWHITDRGRGFIEAYDRQLPPAA